MLVFLKMFNMIATNWTTANEQYTVNNYSITNKDLDTTFLPSKCVNQSTVITKFEEKKSDIICPSSSEHEIKY